MLFVMFSASVLSYTIKPFRRIPQIFPKILRRNRHKSPQIPSGPGYLSMLQEHTVSSGSNGCM